MAKLSIEIDSALFDRVQRYSEQHGTDVASTIQDLIAALPLTNADPDAPGTGEADMVVEEAEWEKELTPTVRRLLGSAVGPADEADYREYLLGRYGK